MCAVTVDAGVTVSDGGGAAASDAKTAMLNVTVHFMKGDEERYMGLKFKLNCDTKTVREAIVNPFVAKYDAKHTDYPASSFQPFSHVKVLLWAGPRPSAADSCRDPDRPGVEDVLRAERPVHALLSVDDPVAELRKRAHDELKPTVEVELVAAESTAIVLRSLPTTALLAPGEQLLAMLTDSETEPDDMHALVDAAIAGGELAYLGLTTARDREGRNALHLAVTRGDVTLCRKLVRRREDVHAMDSNRDTALHMACLAGRQLVVSELLQMGALITEKNRDLMLPLQLAVVDEGQGNGEVVRMLIEAGADIDARCWDITPLMAAAAGGHQWALEVLLELGADTMIRNGYEMMALDYARDNNTAEIIYDFMRGYLLPDADLLKRQQSSREARKRNSMYPPGMSNEPSDKGPRIFQATRVLPLDAAFAALDLPAEWLAAFRASGEHFAAIRREWRRSVLMNHPDRLPATLTQEMQQHHAAVFAKAMAAFEAIDAFYTKNHATPSAHADGEAVAAPAKEAPTGSASRSSEAPPTATALEATARAARPLLFKQRVRIIGLQAKPNYNGRVGRAKAFDRAAQRYCVELDNGGGTLKVKEANLELEVVAEEDDQHV